MEDYRAPRERLHLERPSWKIVRPGAGRQARDLTSLISIDDALNSETNYSLMIAAIYAPKSTVAGDYGA
jgi:hypothetical protein